MIFQMATSKEYKHRLILNSVSGLDYKRPEYSKTETQSSILKTETVQKSKERDYQIQKKLSDIMMSNELTWPRVKAFVCLSTIVLGLSLAPPGHHLDLGDQVHHVPRGIVEHLSTGGEIILRYLDVLGPGSGPGDTVHANYLSFYSFPADLEDLPAHIEEVITNPTHEEGERHPGGLDIPDIKV